MALILMGVDCLSGDEFWLERERTNFGVIVNFVW